VKLFSQKKRKNESHDTAANVSVAGVTDTPWGRVHIRIHMNRHYVHCIGTTAPEVLDQVIWRVDRIGAAPGDEADCPSARARDALKTHLSSHLNRRPEDIEIRRVKDSCGAGPPRAYVNGRPAGVDISLSHDGPFVAYAFMDLNDTLLTQIETANAAAFAHGGIRQS